MSEPKRPPAQDDVEDYRRQDDYTPTLRGAVAAVRLLRAGKSGMSTAEMAAALRMSRSGAWRLMDQLCGAEEFGVYFDSPPGSRGRWFLMMDGRIGFRVDGFEGKPPQR